MERFERLGSGAVVAILALEALVLGQAPKPSDAPPAAKPPAATIQAKPAVTIAKDLVPDAQICLDGVADGCLAASELRHLVAKRHDVVVDASGPNPLQAQVAQLTDQLGACQADQGQLNRLRAASMRGELTSPAQELAAVASANPDYVLDVRTLKITPKPKDDPKPDTKKGGAL